MRTLVYAHRGSSKAYAENTRAAYMQALADGADGIECDIHLSSDGFVVCHHDPTVDRTSDSSGRVGEKTLAELKGPRLLVLEEPVDSRRPTEPCTSSW